MNLKDNFIEKCNIFLAHGNVFRLVKYNFHAREAPTWIWI